MLGKTDSSAFTEDFFSRGSSAVLGQTDAPAFAEDFLTRDSPSVLGRTDVPTFAGDSRPNRRTRFRGRVGSPGGTALLEGSLLLESFWNIITYDNFSGFSFLWVTEMDEIIAELLSSADLLYVVFVDLCTCRWGLNYFLCILCVPVVHGLRRD